MAVCLLAALMLPTAARAVSITPVLLELSAARPVVTFTVSNPSDQPKLFQAQTLSWRQQDGADRYAENDDLLVTPPITAIAPGQTQVFRVSLRNPGPAPVERSYRLMLEDITEVDGAGQGAAVNLRFRFNLPVFAAPVAAARLLPRWSLCKAPAGRGCIRLDNDGNQRLRLSGLAVQGTGARQEIIDATTVLAGGWKEWTFDIEPRRGQPLRISATAEGRVLNAELVPR